jgi:hypothetical protein
MTAAFLLTASALPVTAIAQTRPTSRQSTSASAAPSLLHRHYREGETLGYTMTGTNQADRYQVRAVGEVKRDASGAFYEEFAWSNAVYNGGPMKLPPAAVAFRQRLSLVPDYRLSVPDLSPVVMLVGPITDLLTFYSDYQVASRLPNLSKPGDHAVVPLPMAPSWADGTRIVLGEDSFDFDVTLKEVDTRAHIATILVRHVPPAKPLIKTPADWMRPPVADTPNNWVQVEKNADGTYTAGIGKETFDVETRIDLKTGRILSGTIDNVVEVLERKCADAALTKAGEPSRYQIKRKIELR